MYFNDYASLHIYNANNKVNTVFANLHSEIINQRHRDTDDECGVTCVISN